MTVCPAYPVCVSTASTSSDVPLSAVRGVETRPTWMSCESVSCPTPTVNTGSASAFDASSASATVASVVSAPSVTSTSPETGRPASSCRALSMALASRVCVPPKVRSDGALTRAVDDENRNVRTRKRSDSAFIIGLSGLPNVWRTRSARDPVPVFVSGNCMLRESSSRMPTTFCCATAAFTTSTGRKMQKRMMASAATRSRPSTARSRQCTRSRITR